MKQPPIVQGRGHYRFGRIQPAASPPDPAHLPENPEPNPAIPQGAPRPGEPKDPDESRRAEDNPA